MTCVCSTNLDRPVIWYSKAASYVPMSNEANKRE